MALLVVDLVSWVLSSWEVNGDAGIGSGGEGMWVY